MADENTIALILRAHDEASAAMAAAMDKISRATGELREGVAQAGKASTTFGARLRETTQTIRGTAASLLAEMSPALAGAVSQLGLAGRAAAQMGPVFGSATVAVSLAAVGLGTYLQVLKATTKEQIALATAVREVDLSGLRSQFRDLTQQAELFERTTPKAIQRILDMTRTPGTLNLLDRLLGRVDPRLIEETRAELIRLNKGFEIPKIEAQARGELSETLKMIAAFEGNIAATSEGVDASLKRQIASLREVAEARRRVIEIETSQAVLQAAGRGEFDLAAALSERGAGQQRVLKLQADLTKRALEEGAKAAQIRVAEINFSHAEIRQQIEDEIQAGIVAGWTNTTTSGLLRDAAGLSREFFEALLPEDIRQRRDALALTAEDLERIKEMLGAHKLNTQALFEQLDVMREITKEARDQVGVVRNQIAAQRLEALDREVELRKAGLGLTMAQIDADRQQGQISAGEAAQRWIETQRQGISQMIGEIQRLREEQGRLTFEEGEEGIKRWEALEQRINLTTIAAEKAKIALSTDMSRERGRMDFAAGLQRGLRETQEDLESWGRTGQEVVRNFAATSQQYFKDLFVLPVEKGWKQALEEAPRRFAMNLYNIFADVAARFATAQLFRGLGFQSLAALMMGGAVGMTPGAAGAGALAIHSGSELALAGVAQAGVAGAPGGGGFGVPAIPLGLFPQPSFLSNLMATPLFPASFGAGFAGGSVVGASLTSASEAAALEAAGMLNPAFTLGQGLSFAGGALGLGLTIFSALQGPPTFQNIAMSGVSGAMSGALLGSAIPGVGTVVGAIAGGLLGGGAGMLGKGGRSRRPSASQRSIAAGHAGAQALSQAVAAATSLAELADVLNRQWAPHGEVQLGATGTSQFPGGWTGDWDDPSTWRFTAEALADPDFVDTIWVQVGQTGVVPLHTELTRQVKDKALALAGQERRGVFGFDEPLFGGGITRRTFLAPAPGGLAQAAGQDILVSRSVLRASGLTDDEAEALIRRLAEVDRNRDLGFMTTEEFGFA